MKLLKYLIIVVGLTLASMNCSAQKLKFVRTDVDSSRQKFVTSTFIFGVDVYLDSVKNCGAVAFEIRFNRTKSVKYSGYSKADWGSEGKTIVLPLINESADDGRIVITAGTGIAPDTNAPSNPKILHLDFAVIPAATDGEVVTFNIYNPKATALSDSGAQIIQLKADTINYTIHSFVPVWPGDADNNGSVDHLDFATVSFYLGMGPNFKTKRCFKRDQASALWNSQYVIAWDEAAATYADCDGNGEVNVDDNLVVAYNYDKKRTVSSGIVAEPLAGQDHYFFNDAIDFNSSAYLQIPVYADVYEKILAAASTVSLQGSGDYKIIGVKKGEMFSGAEGYAYYKISDDAKHVDFISGGYDSDKAKTGKNIIAYLIVEPNGASNLSLNPEIVSAKAIADDGFIFPLNTVCTGVAQDKQDDYKLISKSGGIELQSTNSADIQSIEIVDLLGSQVYSSNSNSSSQNIFIPLNVSSGAYFVKISTTNGTITRNISIAN